MVPHTVCSFVHPQVRHSPSPPPGSLPFKDSYLRTNSYTPVDGEGQFIPEPSQFNDVVSYSMLTVQSLYCFLLFLLSVVNVDSVSILLNRCALTYDGSPYNISTLVWCESDTYILSRKLTSDLIFSQADNMLYNTHSQLGAILASDIISFTKMFCLLTIVF